MPVLAITAAGEHDDNTILNELLKIDHVRELAHNYLTLARQCKPKQRVSPPRKLVYLCAFIAAVQCARMTPSLTEPSLRDDSKDGFLRHVIALRGDESNPNAFWSAVADAQKLLAVAPKKRQVGEPAEPDIRALPFRKPKCKRCDKQRIVCLKSPFDGKRGQCLPCSYIGAACVRRTRKCKDRSASKEGGAGAADWDSDVNDELDDECDDKADDNDNDDMPVLYVHKRHQDSSELESGMPKKRKIVSELLPLSERHKCSCMFQSSPVAVSNAADNVSSAPSTAVTDHAQASADSNPTISGTRPRVDQIDAFVTLHESAHKLLTAVQDNKNLPRSLRESILDLTTLPSMSSSAASTALMCHLCSRGWSLFIQEGADFWCAVQNVLNHKETEKVLREFSQVAMPLRFLERRAQAFCVAVPEVCPKSST